MMLCIIYRNKGPFHESHRHYRLARRMFVNGTDTQTKSGIAHPCRRLYRDAKRQDLHKDDFSYGTASLTGLYAFVVNGADASGTVDIGSETSVLKAGFYKRTANTTFYPHGYILDGVALGANMAGVISLH